MNFLSHLRTMDRRLRTMLIATALLLVTQIGQFLAISDINHRGHESDIALLFEFTGIFFIPTSLILTGVILWIIRTNWRTHERLAILGAINLLISLNLAWFLLSACSWSHVFGLALKSCSR